MQFLKIDQVSLIYIGYTLFAPRAEFDKNN